MTMTAQHDYKDIQKAASTRFSVFDEHTTDSGGLEEERGHQETTASRSPRAFFISYYYSDGGDDDCESQYCEPLLTQTASPPLRPDYDHQASPPTRASRIFSKACGCVNRICNRPRRRQLRPRQVSFAADLGHTI